MGYEDLVVALDGGSGSGKTTLGRLLAKSLAGAFLDTGAYYRATAAILGQACADGSPPEELERVALNAAKIVALEFRPKLSVGPEDDDGVIGFLNQQAFEESWLRMPLYTKYLSLVAAFPDVRAVLAPAIRVFVKKYYERDSQTMVAAGRDCGTNLWPQASFKFYIEAPLEVRSARREQQFAQGADDLAARDQADSTRTVAPLRKAPDAVTLDSGKFSPEELCEQAVFNIKQRLEWRAGILFEDTGVGI